VLVSASSMDLRRRPRGRPAIAVLAAGLVLAPVGGRGADARDPARLIVLTDVGGDPDDEQSLVRLLVHANELEIEGLLATSRLEHGHDVRPERIHRLIDAYEAVRPNLSRHAPGYPTADALRARVKAGRGDPTAVGPGLDSAASHWILEVAGRDDPRPLWVAVWGGSRELLQALATAKTRGEREAGRLVSRLRVYLVGDQDGHRSALLRDFPDLHVVACGIGNHGRAKLPEVSAYRGQYQTGDPATVGRAWVDANVREGHGPLGALYPRDGGGVLGMKEGDTPSFLGLLGNGLSLPEEPEWGGWGGRFRQVRERLFVDAQDFRDGVWNERHTVSRWRPAFQAELAARMDWCVAGRREDANHPPVAMVDGEAGTAPVRRRARPGDRVSFDAARSTDPDGDALDFRWWVYHEASGNLAEALTLDGADTPRATLHVPAGTLLRAIHVVLEVTDRGRPGLTRYRRVVVVVESPARRQADRTRSRLLDGPPGGAGLRRGHASMLFRSGATSRPVPVAFRTSSRVVSGAISRRSSPSGTTSITARSVTTRWTHRRPVRGSVQCSRILGAPSRAVCSMATTTRFAPETRSIAPPIPFTILPGTIQFARLPSRSTWSAPRIVRSTWPPRTIAKESALEK